MVITVITNEPKLILSTCSILQEAFMKGPDIFRSKQYCGRLIDTGRKSEKQAAETILE